MIIVLMGVAGAEKDAVGRLLADRLHWPFFEGDDFHPPENVEKMSRGIALSDVDRHPWLIAIGARIRELIDRNESAVFSCSALRAHYRSYLRAGNHPDVRLVHLQGEEPLIHRRIQTRKEPFFQSQFEIMDEPEDAFVVSAQLAPSEIVRRVIDRFGLQT
jgi:gluconokinase